MTLVDKFTEDVLTNEYFISIFNKCSLLTADDNLNIKNTTNLLTNKELKDSFRFADILSNSDSSEARNKAYQIITYLNHQYSNNLTYKTMAKAIYSKLGNFPAVSYLNTNNRNDIELPILREIETETKKIIQAVPDSNSLVFTDSQYELYQKLSNTREFSFSGPTSMGKSFIIKSFIKKVMKNTPPENLVIIVPTRALINQFALDLKNEVSELLEQYRYRILTNSNVNSFIDESPYNYILVLTPERFLSYLSQEENPSIGFLFIDEAHKLANEKDSRSITTYTAIEKSLKKYGNIKLYFSSPNVTNPEIFLKLFNRYKINSTYKTTTSPVSQNIFFINLLNSSIEFIQDKNITEIINTDFFEEIKTTSELIHFLGNDKNNLIYCNGTSKTIHEANIFADNVVPSELSDNLKNAIKQIEEYIHPDYYLVRLLKSKVAFHYGKLPQVLRNLVEDLYKKEEIRNVFCTSTLLEGVNMPTQNIFILNNKNGLRKLSPIDFWNLSGRAGRLSKELSGNIYCVQHNDCTWDNKEILNKTDIVVTPTVLTKIDRNIQKIEKLLNGKDISGTEEEKYILKYIANIISVDTLEILSNYKSPIIEKLIQNNKTKIIELAKEKVKDYIIPSYILNSNQSINLNIQNQVYKKLVELNNNGSDIKFPNNSTITYDVCKSFLKKMYTFYEWGNAEKKLNNINSINYYALIMNQWINGISLSQMIKSSIEYYELNNNKIEIARNEYAPYEAGNVKHINIVIENIIEDIEYILRFLFEKYFNHYYQLLQNILGKDNSGENWASLLEYGTQNRIAIALQNIGLSRHIALKIYTKCKDALIIKDGKLEGIHKELILKKFNKDSVEYNEIFITL
ncbi:MAG: DEAD/DEAH box helicase [Aliarcobacter butzleri]|nr:DEAD/DEAH box helicase [Aliarcobacter butzleri]